MAVVAGSRVRRKTGLKTRKKRRPSKRAKISESVVQRHILEYLTLKGIPAWRNQGGSVYDPTRKTFRKKRGRYELNGVSDILGFLPPYGRLLAIEVKRPYIKGVQTAGTVSDEQEKFLEVVRRGGGIGFAAHSVDDVIRELKPYLPVKTSRTTISS